MVAAVDTKASQLFAITAAAYPADDIDASMLVSTVGVISSEFARTSQLFAIVAARGRVSDPKVRAWTFTLDGHDFYVLRLGAIETLVYDVFAEQWYVWGSDDTDIWRASTGKNWLGGTLWGGGYGSNALVGDELAGVLYFLDPDGVFDEDPVSGSDIPHPFLCEITGQVPSASFDMISCFGVKLLGSLGEDMVTSDAVMTEITLHTSDDGGNTYDEHDTLTFAADEFNGRAEWWSLGAFAAPGRLFKIQDRGALKRIDGLEMIEEPES